MIRKLTADEIECRIAQIKYNGFTLLLYKTARVDRAILDEIYPNRWQNDFKVLDGKMYGGIGIYDESLKEWLWRWDCGVESNSDAEKGQASDCFKRAGFKWGIGIELYSAPFIWISSSIVPVEKNEKGKYQLKNPFEKFMVSTISYTTNGTISDLVITDSKGNIIFSNNKKIKTVKKEQETEDIITDSDIDIITGIEAFNDLTNLTKYFVENQDKVQNFDAFKTACTRRKEFINKKKGCKKL